MADPTPDSADRLFAHNVRRTADQSIVLNHFQKALSGDVVTDVTVTRGHNGEPVYGLKLGGNVTDQQLYSQAGVTRNIDAPKLQRFGNEVFIPRDQLEPRLGERVDGILAEQRVRSAPSKPHATQTDTQLVKEHFESALGGGLRDVQSHISANGQVEYELVVDPRLSRDTIQQFGGITQGAPLERGGGTSLYSLVRVPASRLPPGLSLQAARLHELELQGAAHETLDGALKNARTQRASFDPGAGQRQNFVPEAQMDIIRGIERPAAAAVAAARAAPRAPEPPVVRYPTQAEGKINWRPSPLAKPEPPPGSRMQFATAEQLAAARAQVAEQQRQQQLQQQLQQQHQGQHQESGQQQQQQQQRQHNPSATEQQTQAAQAGQQRGPQPPPTPPPQHAQGAPGPHGEGAPPHIAHEPHIEPPAGGGKFVAIPHIGHGLTAAGAAVTALQVGDDVAQRHYAKAAVHAGSFVAPAVGIKAAEKLVAGAAEKAPLIGAGFGAVSAVTEARQGQYGRAGLDALKTGLYVTAGTSALTGIGAPVAIATGLAGAAIDTGEMIYDNRVVIGKGIKAAGDWWNSINAPQKPQATAPQPPSQPLPVQGSGRNLRTQLASQHSTVPQQPAHPPAQPPVHVTAHADGHAHDTKQRLPAKPSRIGQHAPGF